MKFVEQTEWKWLPIRDLRPNPANSNKHSDEQIERLVKLIKYYGWRQPIIISNRSGLIAAGHARLLAAKAMGMSEVPVQYQNFEDDDEERGFLVADNSIAAWAELDLSLINAQMGDFDPGFDLDLLGIKDFTLDMADKEFGSGEDEVPEAPPEPVVKRGELWILGEHRLLIDDCTVKENVERLMAGEKADMVFTDPPYNLAGNHDGELSLLANARPNSYGKLKDAAWNRSDFDVRPALDRILEVVKENTTVYVSLSHYSAPKCWEWMSEWAKFYGFCIWKKTNPMPSLSKRHWTWDTEIICYATRGKHVFNFPAQGHASSVWESATASGHGDHPTPKPVTIPKIAIQHSSKAGDLLFEPFCGSGTTIVACEELGRRCYAAELEPTYGQVIIERWQKFSGKKAVREDGLTFDSLKENGQPNPSFTVKANVGQITVGEPLKYYSRNDGDE